MSGIECAWRAPPGNVGNMVGAKVAKVGDTVGARVGGLVSPALVGAGVLVGTRVGAAHAQNAQTQRTCHPKPLLVPTHEYL